MPSREQYNECLRPYISGHHEDRKLSFCAGAKICSGRASSLAEAEKICREQPPKDNPGPRKSRGAGKACSPQSLEKITTCLVNNVNFNATDMNKELRDNLAKCMCGRTEKKLSKAESAVMALDADQRAALMQFMTEHGTSTKKDKV